MASDLLSVYDAFEMHSEPFVASTTGTSTLQRFCHTKYGPENPMPKPEWGMWGDRDKPHHACSTAHTVEGCAYVPGPDGQKYSLSFATSCATTTASFQAIGSMKCTTASLLRLPYLLWRVISAPTRGNHRRSDSGQDAASAELVGRCQRHL